MRLDIGPYKLDIDVERTRAFYDSAELITLGCSCLGCENYEKAVDCLPQEIRNFFDSIGVDMKKAAEINVNCKNEDNTIYYGGFYHICGKLIEGDSAWVEAEQTEDAVVSHWQSENAYPITKNYRVSFSDGAALLEEGFPLPVLQMEIEAHIPWVLEEEFSYG